MYLVQHFYKEEMPNFLQLWVKKSYKITKKNLLNMFIGIQKFIEFDLTHFGFPRPSPRYLIDLQFANSPHAAQ